MTGELELSFTTTTKDWTEVRSLLNALALRRENFLTYVLTHRGIMAGIVQIVLLGFCSFILIRYLPKLLDRDLVEIINIKSALCLLVVGFALWVLGRYLGKLVANLLAPEERSRPGRKGVHWGHHHVQATPQSLTVSLSACRSIYNWEAFLSLKKTTDLLLLQLTDRSAVAIPRNAFKSKADETMFCNYVRERMSS